MSTMKVKRAQKDYAGAISGGHSPRRIPVAVETRRRKFVAPASETSRRREVLPATQRPRLTIDAKPIVDERKRKEALRAKQGLVQEWVKVMNAIDHDLRGWAESLMRDIGDFLVRRASAPQPSYSW